MSSAAETSARHTAQDTVNTVKKDNQVGVNNDDSLNTIETSSTDTVTIDMNNLKEQNQTQVQSDETKGFSDTQGPQNTSLLSPDSTNSIVVEEKDKSKLQHALKENFADSDESPTLLVSQDNPETVADEGTTSPPSSEGIQSAGSHQNMTSHGDHNDTHLPTARGRRDSSPRVDDNLGDNQQQQQQHEEVRRDSANAQRRRDSADEGRSYSTEDETSDWETPVDVELEVSHAGLVQRSGKATWSTVRALTRLMPMAHSLPWSQLAGHKGSFLAGPEGTVLKLRDACEEKNLSKLREEGGALYTRYIPHFSGTVKKEGKASDYVQMEDLQSGFSSPSIMDVKMGLRTYLVQEMLKAQKEATLRKDLYEKLVSVDPDAPTPEEKTQQKITKTRYLKFRDDLSSTSSLGFRIEGIKTPSIASKDFKRTKTSEDVQKALSDFIGDNTTALKKYISLLQEMQKEQESSQFFRSHEIVGSSLLFIHDSSGKTGVWMIDFAKCSPLPAKVTVDHRSQWQSGNYEDGYWLGLDNLRSIFQRIDASRQKK